MLTSFFTAISEAIAARKAYYTTISELSKLGDRDLQDLGIDRTEIYRVAAESAIKRINPYQVKVS